MHIRGWQDFATGVLFVAIGLGALWIGADYAMGTAQRPGTGVLPRILAWCLIGCGGLLVIKAFLSDGPDMGAWAWRPLIMVTLALIAFSVLIDRLGLVVAMLASMTLAALGTPQTRWGEYAIFSIIMLVIGVGMFIYGLGMPVRALPWN